MNKILFWIMTVLISISLFYSLLYLLPTIPDFSNTPKDLIKQKTILIIGTSKTGIGIDTAKDLKKKIKKDYNVDLNIVRETTTGFQYLYYKKFLENNFNKIDLLLIESDLFVHSLNKKDTLNKKLNYFIKTKFFNKKNIRRVKMHTEESFIKKTFNYEYKRKITKPIFKSDLINKTKIGTDFDFNLLSKIKKVVIFKMPLTEEAVLERIFHNTYYKDIKSPFNKYNIGPIKEKFFSDSTHLKTKSRKLTYPYIVNILKKEGFL